MSYRLAIKPSARQELERLDDVSLRRVDAAMLKLAENPRPHGVKKLTGVPSIDFASEHIALCIR